MSHITLVELPPVEPSVMAQRIRERMWECDRSLEAWTVASVVFGSFEAAIADSRSRAEPLWLVDIPGLERRS